MQSDFQYPFPLLIIAGKGGVGKTVLTAAIGTESAGSGHSTLVVELGGQRQLLPLLCDDVDGLGSPDETGIITISDSLSWQSLSPDRLLAGWLSGRSMGLIADRLETSGALSVIASSVPGIKDVLLLGHLRSLVDTGKWERIIVDGPASGRARELLRAPRQVAEASIEGPIFDQASRAHSLLTDPKTTAVLLVTLAEETPVNETIETAFDIEDDPGVHLAGVIVNRVFPDCEPPKTFDDHPIGETLRNRHLTNVEQMARLEEELPVPQAHTWERPAGVIKPKQATELLDLDVSHITATSNAPEIAASVDTAVAASALSLALENDIIVTVGTGGVGKTTIGAALAYKAACAGRSVALITIDPAKRLADALGIDALDDDLRDIAIVSDSGTAGGKGRLQATMLDAGRTFSRVLHTHAGSAEHAERVLNSPLATQLVDSLSGMTEYMAVERVWELHNDPDIDLVVVDTPPSADALAFLDAPTLLARLLDNRMYRILVHGKRKSLVNRALGGIVGQLVATVGGTVMREAVDFFKSFEGLEEGFRERGDAIHEILRGPGTSFIVVASPTGSSLANANDFVAQLAEVDVTPTLAIVNRCTPKVKAAGRSAAAIRLIEHLRQKRSAERFNIGEFIETSALPIVTVDDRPAPVTTLEDVEALAKSLGA